MIITFAPQQPAQRLPMATVNSAKVRQESVLGSCADLKPWIGWLATFALPSTVA